MNGQARGGRGPRLAGACRVRAGWPDRSRASYCRSCSTLALRASSGPLALNLTSEALFLLLTVLGVAGIGGVVSALLASVTTSLRPNYDPRTVGDFTFAEANIC